MANSLFRDKNLSPASLAIVAIRHKLIGYIFKMAAQHPKLASDFYEKFLIISQFHSYQTLNRCPKRP
jgi:hypothetical protein